MGKCEWRDGIEAATEALSIGWQAWQQAWDGTALRMVDARESMSDGVI